MTRNAATFEEAIATQRAARQAARRFFDTANEPATDLMLYGDAYVDMRAIREALRDVLTSQLARKRYLP